MISCTPTCEPSPSYARAEPSPTDPRISYPSVPDLLLPPPEIAIINGSVEDPPDRALLPSTPDPFAPPSVLAVRDAATCSATASACCLLPHENPNGVPPPSPLSPDYTSLHCCFLLHRHQPDLACLRARQHDLWAHPRQGLFPGQCSARPPRRRPDAPTSYPYRRRQTASRRWSRSLRGQRGGKGQGGGVRREARGFRRCREAQDHQGAKDVHESGQRMSMSVW